MTGHWGVCVCGRKLYEHSRLGRDYVCTALPGGRFESETDDAGYDPEKGLAPADKPVDAVAKEQARAAAAGLYRPGTGHAFCREHGSWFCPCVAPGLYSSGGAEKWPAITNTERSTT